MKIKAIINPSSGRKLLQKDLVKMLKKRRSNGLIDNLDCFYTSKQNDAYEEVAKLKVDDTDIIVVCGGDGTIFEVVNSIIDHELKIPLAILAAGTVNDFASALQLPRNTEELDRLLDNYHVCSVDVGKVGKHHFLNVCAGGALSEVAYKTPIELKTIFGRLAYILYGIASFPMGIMKTKSYRLTLPDEVIEDDLLLFVVGNTTSVGGFKHILPLGSVTDGKLDLLAIRSATKNVKDFSRLPILLAELTKGEHLDSDLIIYRQTPWVKIETLDGSSVILDYDGERGEKLPQTISNRPGAIRLVLPKS